MLDYIVELDQQLFLALNGLQTPYFDSYMWLISGKFAYVLLALAFLYVSYKKGWKECLLVIFTLALTILFADQIASGILKPLVCRLRPSRDKALEGLVYIVNGYRGGKYGFASSHAANAFGAAMLIALLFRNKGLTIWMFVWAALVAYSRIYLGVHYPGDIICGALIGVGSAYVSYRLSAILAKKMNYDMHFGEKDAKVIKISVMANLGVLLIVACFYAI